MNVMEKNRCYARYSSVANFKLRMLESIKIDTF